MARDRLKKKAAAKPEAETSKPREEETPPEQSEAREAVADFGADSERSLDELASLQEELDKAKEHALRWRAEMENFKKRVSRQSEEERRYTLMPIMQDLLPVLDNMDRAIEAAEKSENGGGLLEGFQMVAQQLQGVLAKYDCKQIEAMHQPFDPNLHEAISQMPNEDFPANTVVCVAETGYQLHDRVVRPTKVIVSTRPE